MAALVQSFPQPANPVSMLQPRPNSASGAFQNVQQGHPLPLPLHNPRTQAMPRNIYSANGAAMNGYRGQAAHHPVVPYAFTSTPSLNSLPHSAPAQAGPHLRQENRTFSAPAASYQRLSEDLSGLQRFAVTGPVSSTSTTPLAAPNPNGEGMASSNDEPSNASDPRSGLQSRVATAIPSTIAPTLTHPQVHTGAKPSPDRYRRAHRRPEATAVPAGSASSTVPAGSALPSGSGMATVGHLYAAPRPNRNGPPASGYQSFGTFPQRGPRQHVASGNRPISMDDMSLYRQPQSDPAKRYRRRSVSSLDVADFTPLRDAPEAPGLLRQRSLQSDQMIWTGPVTPARPASARPASAHRRTGSAESNKSAKSASQRPTGKRESGMTPFKPLTPLTANPVAGLTSPLASSDARSGSGPPRAHGEPGKRLTQPSPLSRPMPESPESSMKTAVTATGVGHHGSSQEPNAESAATRQLQAVSEKPAKKGGKSRLRRAFSFGSAAELRKASAENNLNNAANERAKVRKDNSEDEQDAVQAAIAAKQEEGGIGESIYSGQGNFFSGSTDNLSISSTASSASVMIRKMGKGMKKSTRSLVGLFRTKSTVGPPAPEETTPGPGLAQVSMVTVEAEREKVNVNVDPHDQVGGGTGYPRLERNSLDAAAAAAALGADSGQSSRDGSSIDSGRPRRSIVGGDRERADILAAVKKGILKRTGAESGNSSPVTGPSDARTPEFVLPHIPQVSDASPHSSAPSTPRDDRPAQAQLGHRRTDSVTIEGEDYFMSLPKFGFQESKSVPGTPQSMAKYNVSFSPRIQFHDTWTSGEYDRRGEIATCNRLTPMLAQQIKEELNSFKMEMEVHEHSKVYTHFF